MLKKNLLKWKKFLKAPPVLKNIDQGIVSGVAEPNVTKDQYCDMVNKAKQYIYDGDIFQVVLSQRWKIECDGRSVHTIQKAKTN